jgi:VanZ family protein
VKNGSEKGVRQQGSNPDMTISPNTRTHIVVFHWLPVIVYCLLIFIQSSYPASDSLPSFPYADKLAHAGGYALLGFLFYRAYRTTGMGDRVVALLILSALSASAYGVSDEFHQYFVPSRTADIFDAAADAVGGVLGAVLAQVVFHRQWRLFFQYTNKPFASTLKK